MKTLLIEPQVFPPVQYFTKYILYDKITLDTSHRFVKQSYRNRYRILGANKVLDLVIPVRKGKTRVSMHDVLLAEDENWKREHLQSLRSAYGKAPYFDHYFQQIEEIYQRNETQLFNWCLNTIKWAEGVLGLLSASVAQDSIAGFRDFRDSIHPKARYSTVDAEFSPAVYFQCFGIDTFTPNLSILDLVFNEGPNSLSVLESSIPGDYSK